jgi:hypothetical protein
VNSRHSFAARKCWQFCLPPSRREPQIHPIWGFFQFSTTGHGNLMYEILRWACKRHNSGNKGPRVRTWVEGSALPSDEALSALGTFQDSRIAVPARCSLRGTLSGRLLADYSRPEFIVAKKGSLRNASGRWIRPRRIRRLRSRWHLVFWNGSQG